MSTLTIRLPDEKHDRLRQLAKLRQLSLNKLIEELATVALAPIAGRLVAELSGAGRRPRCAGVVHTGLDPVAEQPIIAITPGDAR